MKCTCGNEFNVRMAAKADCKGCSILTTMTTVITVKCAGCGAVFQLPVQTDSFIIKKPENTVD